MIIVMTEGQTFCI